MHELRLNEKNPASYSAGEKEFYLSTNKVDSSSDAFLQQVKEIVANNNN